MKLKTLTIFSLALLVWLAGCGRRKYDNPIGTNSQQPDKILFDKAINDLEKHHYDTARLTLQTMMNTYPDSEYIAKAKLAVADSWYREGTRHALAQAEAEYKDFITFFPTMQEASESQMKICDIHFEQMVKPDRDNTHATKADQECRQLIMQWPNSVFLGDTKQRLREIQEVIAGAEYKVGAFYMKKGSFRAGANRLQAVTDHYPLFSEADEALWNLADSYEKMGEQFEEDMVSALTKLVSEYPLSPRVEEAKGKLTALNRAIPEPDQERYKVMEFNLAAQSKKGPMKKVLTMFGNSPNVRMAARMGDPIMTPFMPSTPVGIRQSTGLGGTAPSAEVTAETVEGPSALDTEPDARINQPQQDQDQ